MKKIAILGSTGKIGTQTLDIVRQYPNDFQVVGLACNHESRLFKEQIKEFKPKIVCIYEKDGQDKLIEVATQLDVDLVIVAVVGIAGLLPTLAAIKAKKDIALATKEVLVIGGNLVMDAVKQNQVQLIPLDSEHSALFQCLTSHKPEEINKLILTMGKGPIAKLPKEKLAQITMQDVFNRPNWTMGTKIAVDSATGINKTFEVIEACYLFQVPIEKIDIVVHPEYLCHSLVEFVDGSIITELGIPDMHRYIHYALFYPKRKPILSQYKLNILEKNLSFEKPPYDKFPCLKFGFEVMKKGGTLPAIMHGADTAAVKAFVNKQISFTQIPEYISMTIASAQPIQNPSLNQLIDAEAWGQVYAQDLIKKQKEVM